MTNKNALIIFTRNPELGKCKTRLAKTIGDEAALEIYKFLLQHTATVAQKTNADKYVFYSEEITENDIWSNEDFYKKIQKGADLGERMQNAFSVLFQQGYKNVLIIGSDLFDLNETIVNDAFGFLDNHEFVIGPAEDGGYYLLGMQALETSVFQNKVWGTETVFEQTIANLSDKNVKLMQVLNDIDTFEDIVNIKEFEKYIP